MKLSAPTQLSFTLGVFLFVLGLLGALFTIPVLTANAFWIVVVGFLVLAAGTMLKGF